MLKIFGRHKTETIDDVIKNNECQALLQKVIDTYGKELTGVLILVEKNKETFWYCAGIEPAQVILSLDQLHHRVQHEDYD